MIMIIAKVKELLYLLNYNYHVMDHYNNNNINNNNDNNNSNNNNNKSCTIISADLNLQIKLQ